MRKFALRADPCPWSFLRHARSLNHREDTVDGGNRDLLFGSAGPVNLDLLHLGPSSQTEVYSLVGIRSVTAAAENVHPLPYPARGHIDFGSDRVSRAFRSPDQLQFQPVVRVLHHI